MRPLRRLGRPRLIALAVAACLAIAGVLLAVVAPGARPVIPQTAPPDSHVPLLEYVKSLPGPGDDALVRPVGLAFASGTLYVSDSGAGVVRAFTARGRDRGEIGRGVLLVPGYVAVDEATGTLLVADRELGAVVRFSKDGKHTGELKPVDESTAAWAPLGVAADGLGAIAVGDSLREHRILLMSRAGAVTARIGADDANGSDAAAIDLDHPNSLAFKEGELWVSDSNNRRVLVFGPGGDLRRLVRLQGITRGLAFLEGDDAELGYVAVVDTLASDIVLLSADGDEVSRYGRPGRDDGELAYPNDIAFDPDTAQLFVADTGNARVQVWRVSWPSDPGGDAGIRRVPMAASRLFGLVLAGVGAALAAVIALFRAR